MTIKYKIIEVNPYEHQIVVRFYSDLLPEDALATQRSAQGAILRARTDYAITLPIPAPDGNELRDLITRHCPRDFFAMKEKIASRNVDTSLSRVSALLNREFTVPD